VDEALVKNLESGVDASDIGAAEDEACAVSPEQSGEQAQKKAGGT
jgi:hypothetical protein